MKIAFFSSDAGNHKFIIPIIEKLKEQGIPCQLYTNWTIDEEATVYWFDFCDNNLIVASKEYKEQLKNKKVIARLHAVEYYMGFHNSIDWSVVNDLIVVSEHMKRKIGELPTNIHVIHNGIDLEKFTYKERQSGFNIGYAGNIVPTKGILLMFHYFKQLVEKNDNYKLYMVGLNRFHGREGEYYNHYIESAGLKDHIIEASAVDDINTWLDNINYLWQPSLAESFSIIVGEAMSKGIKPIINNFNGSEEIWPKELIYSDINKFNEIITGEYNSKTYRYFVEKYSLTNQLKAINEIIKT